MNKRISLFSFIYRKNKLLKTEPVEFSVVTDFNRFFQKSLKRSRTVCHIYTGDIVEGWTVVATGIKKLPRFKLYSTYSTYVPCSADDGMYCRRHFDNRSFHLLGNAFTV